MAPPLSPGLFFALSFAAAATPAASAPVDFSRAERVRISLSSFQIAPGTLRLKAGQPVILTIVNDGFGGHDLSASEFFAAAAIHPGDAQLIHQGMIRVRAGGTA